MSVFARTRLDDSWLEDSDLDNSTNADTNRDSEPDTSCDSELDVEPDAEPDAEPDVDDMPLPPKDFYTTQEELFASIQAWAKQHKYSFRIGRSKTIGKHWKKYYYICTCCGPKPIIDRPQNDPQRPRDRIHSTKSKKTSCEFSVCGVQVDNHH